MRLARRPKHGNHFAAGGMEHPKSGNARDAGPGGLAGGLAGLAFGHKLTHNSRNRPQVRRPFGKCGFTLLANASSGMKAAVFTWETPDMPHLPNMPPIRAPLAPLFPLTLLFSFLLVSQAQAAFSWISAEWGMISVYYHGINDQRSSATTSISQSNTSLQNDVFFGSIVSSDFNIQGRLWYAGGKADSGVYFLRSFHLDSDTTLDLDALVGWRLSQNVQRPDPILAPRLGMTLGLMIVPGQITMSQLFFPPYTYNCPEFSGPLSPSSMSIDFGSLSNVFGNNAIGDPVSCPFTKPFYLVNNGGLLDNILTNQHVITRDKLPTGDYTVVGGVEVAAYALEGDNGAQDPSQPCYDRTQPTSWCFHGFASLTAEVREVIPEAPSLVVLATALVALATLNRFRIDINTARRRTDLVRPNFRGFAQKILPFQPVTLWISS